MKRITHLLLFGLLVPMLASCYQTWSPEPMPTSAYQPIFMSRQQLEASVMVKPAQPLATTGKIYNYGNYILINELFKGVHIIDNQDPRSPQNIGFIQVPGNVDFAMKSNVIYVDNAVDLVAINLADPENPYVAKRVPNVFPAPMPPDNLPAEYDQKGLPADAVIVGWKLKVK